MDHFRGCRPGGGWFDLSVFNDVFARLRGAPGQVIRATVLRLLAASEGLPNREQLALHFSPHDLTDSEVWDGRARVWTDFRLHPDGFGRLLLSDQGLEGQEVPQLVQQLQDLGNYRKMALLGLPIARETNLLLVSLEEALVQTTTEIAAGRKEDDVLLGQLTALSAQLAEITARSRYRMAATQAYTQLCLERLSRLNVQPVRGYRSLKDLTEQRLLPAARTCEALWARVEDLSNRTSAVSDLLRTRIDTQLSIQNRDLLASMENRARLQLHLQQMVERLSLVAIAYYAVALLAYVLKPFHGWHVEAILGLAVPTALATVWLLMKALSAKPDGKVSCCTKALP